MYYFTNPNNTSPSIFTITSVLGVCSNTGGVKLSRPITIVINEQQMEMDRILSGHHILQQVQFNATH